MLHNSCVHSKYKDKIEKTGTCFFFTQSIFLEVGGGIQDGRHLVVF